ncbi:MAG: transposase [Verrucomicrobiia bacterium]
MKTNISPAELSKRLEPLTAAAAKVFPTDPKTLFTTKHRTSGSPGHQLMNETPEPESAEPGVNLPRKTGRRSLRTPERATAIAEALGRGLPVAAACRIANVSPATYRDWRAKDQDFDEQCELAIAQGIQARLAIIEAASLTDWRAAAWLLERCSPEQFSRNRVEHQHLHIAAADKVLIYLPAKTESHNSQNSITHEITDTGSED